ncbi:putative reverse transcriptase domain-containing protein [Tanacetum coccineum]|uniref:Reverse transcriptase domain-containing protein n=1 Tax=Tanacetum coccineum TaxID=301880 RepID=A0ABQ4Z4P5_9ASTR
MDWLSKRKFVIVCHEKVVRIPLEGDEILQVHGERTQGVVKTLMNTKVVEFRIDLVHGATPVVKSLYRLAPSKMQELSEELQELQDEVLELLRNEKLYAKFTKSEKRRVKLRRVRAMSMTISSQSVRERYWLLLVNVRDNNAPAKAALASPLKMQIRSSLGLYLLPETLIHEVVHNGFQHLKQLDEFDVEEIDLKGRLLMISMRMKKFYKKTSRKLQFDAKEPVGFDKTKVECYNCHKTGHFARECSSGEWECEDVILEGEGEGSGTCSIVGKSAASCLENAFVAGFSAYLDIFEGT